MPSSSQNGDSENDASDTSPDDLSLEDEDEDELEIRQTQIIQEKYAHIVDETNKPAEQGILERVECYNFMCHDHFSVELGPLINFIVGKNGSGKSAILTAITLCLGGKASATQRGGSLKSFVKQGKENATIIVRIKNSGDGAYMSSDYGKSIIVERHFSRTGASGFKLKAENGRIVSTKKAELDAITDYFSMQIDNPMNVLSQDSARQFLSTSSPAEKYKFFVKGVQLEQLDQDYRLIEESVDQIEEKLRTKAEDIRILENRRNAAKRKLEISDQQDSLRDRRKNIRNQMAWAQVEEQEKVGNRQPSMFRIKLMEIRSGIPSREHLTMQMRRLWPPKQLSVNLMKSSGRLRPRQRRLQRLRTMLTWRLKRLAESKKRSKKSWIKLWRNAVSCRYVLWLFVCTSHTSC